MPLEITIPAGRLYDEANRKFITIPKPTTLVLEHSLISLTKWESKWHKPFLNERYKKTFEETIDYIRCMTLNKGVDPRVYYGLTQENIAEIQAYIDDPMTATTIKEDPRKKSNGTYVTNEVIYYWLTALQIPFDPCERWHLNRLITFVKVCDEKNKPPKKMKNGELATRNHALNEARLKARSRKR